MSKAKSRTDGLIEKTKIINGKRMHFYGKTVREVQKKIDEAIVNAVNKQECGELFEYVAEDFWKWKAPKLKYNTMRGYRHQVDLVKDWFSGYGMREITGTMINKQLSRMAKMGCSYKTIANQKSVLSMIFQFWCSEMDGDTNPCALLKLPKGLPQKKRRAPTDAEIDKVKENPDGFGLCAAFMMYAGLRLGEVMALQKKDIANGTISVTKAVVWHSNKPEIDTPKTENSVRQVPILNPLKNSIGNRLDGLRDEDYIFGGKQPLTKSQYELSWLYYLKSIGCAHDSGKKRPTGKCGADGRPLFKALWEPDFTAHQLRHEFASTLVACNINLQVAKTLMGHADIITTQKWYAEAKSRDVSNAIEKLNEYLS